MLRAQGDCALRAQGHCVLGAQGDCVRRAQGDCALRGQGYSQEGTTDLSGPHISPSDIAHAMDYTALCSARWDALCSRLSVGAETAATWWSTLHDAYEGPGRYYHTLRHVAELLLHLDAHRASVSDVDAVELATFFHDVVYNAQSGGGGRNELDSAEVWRDFARAAQLAALEEKVARWIVQTKDHRCTDADELDCKLFMDFDMAILATPPAEYAAYAANVRREYGHLSTAAWCYGRGAFLRSFAQSDAPIFATPAFRDAGEAAARRNAATEAVMLRRRRRRRLLAMVALTGACGALSLLALFAPSGMLRGGARLCGAAAGALGLAWAGTQYEPYPYAKAPGAAAGGVALFAGSMNPPHHGHLGIIAHLAAAHASVVVVIGHNPSKRYAVTPQQRKELTEKACQAAGLRNVTCEVTDDYVWRVRWAVHPFHCSGSMGAPSAQCASSVHGVQLLAWPFGRTRNPYFVRLRVSLLFDNSFLMLLLHREDGTFGFSSNFTHFHPFFSTFCAHFPACFHFSVHFCLRRERQSLTARSLGPSAMLD